MSIKTITFQTTATVQLFLTWAEWNEIWSDENELRFFPIVDTEVHRVEHSDYLHANLTVKADDLHSLLEIISQALKSL